MQQVHLVLLIIISPHSKSLLPETESCFPNQDMMSTHCFQPLFIHSFVLLLGLPHGIWSSQVRDQIQVTIATYAAAAATHCAGLGIEPGSWRCRDTTDPIGPQWELLQPSFISEQLLLKKVIAAVGNTGAV